MRRTSFAEVDCSIAQTLEVVGEWWTLMILRDAFQGVRRFDDFQQDLGIARNVLTQRLQRLVSERILERRRYQTQPERFEYRLTEKGIDLYPVLISLMRWGDRWAVGKDGPPLVLTHKSCGHEGLPAMACPGCAEEIGARDMSFRWRRRRERSVAASAGAGATSADAVSSS
jgi:DNA-binding HxlR family transcriptional regulator